MFGCSLIFYVVQLLSSEVLPWKNKRKSTFLLVFRSVCTNFADVIYCTLWVFLDFLVRIRRKRWTKV